MFGDLMGNMQQQQAAMQEKLTAMDVNAEAGDGIVKIEGTAAREVLNVSIDKSKIDLSDTEELEDLLVVAFNRFTEKVMEIEAKATEESLKSMMPPGMDGLAGLFGK